MNPVSAQQPARYRTVALLLVAGLLLWLPLLQGEASPRRRRSSRRSSTGKKAKKSNRQGPFLPTAPAPADSIRVIVTDDDGSERDLDDDLRLACNSAELERASELLDVRREVEAVENLDPHPRDAYGNSPLHDVARRGLLQVAELLLDEGAYDVNLANGMGDVALHMSAAAGHSTMTKLLVEHGAHIDAQTLWGMTPLWWSASGGDGRKHIQVARFLLARGADVNIRTTANQTILMEAARQGHADMAQILVDAGVDVNAREGLGETALHKAAAAGHTEIVRVLVSAGLSVDARNLAGETVLDVAHRTGRTKIVEYLTGTNHSSSDAASTIVSSSAEDSPIRCPDGVQQPLVACGHLEPSAYIADLQNGPSHVYSSLRRHSVLFAGPVSSEASWPPLSWFARGVQAALAQSGAGRSVALAALLEPESEGVYSFELFSAEFCKMFLDEMENYRSSGLPSRRVNSMNRYGLIVNEIGMYDMISELQKMVLQPIAAAVYPIEGSAFNKHHSFVVQYKPEKDPGLDLHTDDSDVTFNVCLGRQFTNATLAVCGLGGTPNHRQYQQSYVHRIGRCLVHKGRHRHGADDISSGERQNLVIWNTNFAYRRSEQFRIDQEFQKEAAPPDPRCLSYTHDRDYPLFKSYPTDRTYRSAESRDEARAKAWCPPAGACYDGMEPAPTLSALRAHHQEL